MLHLVLLAENTPGQARKRTFDLSFDGPYPSGGEVLTLRDIMLSYVQSVLVSGAAGYSFSYDRFNERLHVFGFTIVGTITQDLPVYFTEPGDPLNSPAKVPEGVEGIAMTAQVDEIAPGTDLTALQHLQLIVEGY